MKWLVVGILFLLAGLILSLQLHVPLLAFPCGLVCLFCCHKGLKTKERGLLFTVIGFFGAYFVYAGAWHVVPLMWRLFIGHPVVAYILFASGAALVFFGANGLRKRVAKAYSTSGLVLGIALCVFAYCQIVGWV